MTLPVMAAVTSWPKVNAGARRIKTTSTGKVHAALREIREFDWMVLIITPLLLRDRCLSFCFGQSWASQPRMSSSKRLSRCYGEVRYSTEHYWFQHRFQSWLQSFVALLRVVVDGSMQALLRHGLDQHSYRSHGCQRYLGTRFLDFIQGLD